MKLIGYDATDTFSLSSGHGEDGTARGPLALSPWWRVGSLVHGVARRARGESFAARAVTSWEETLRWAASHPRVSELQVWGHGGWGFMDVGGSRLDVDALGAKSPLAASLDALRGVLTEDATVWLRCCSAFGAREGHRFAPALAHRMRARVAGHTYVIHVLQSGTHALRPGASADWALEEGVVMAEGRPLRAKDSLPFEPRTISCLRLDLPAGW